jgi:metallopeptidase family M12-like protein
MRYRRFLACGVVLILISLLSGCASGYRDYGNARPEKPAVLVPTNRKPEVDPVPPAKVIRQQTVEVDVTSIAPPHNQVVALPLFPGTTIEAVGVRIERAGRGYVWIGEVRDEPTSLVVLSVQGSVLAGNVLSRRGNYEIRPAGRGISIVRELDPATFKEDDVNTGLTPSKLAEQNPNADPCGGVDTGESIDALIAYTATARANNGGTDGVEALIYAAVASANQSYLNSAINQRMRIVHLAEVAYTESGNSCTDLNRIHDSDGVLDNLLTLRNTHGADLVGLMVDGALVSTSNGFAANGCTAGATGVFGEAYNILNPNTSAFEPNAFAVVQLSAGTSNLTFAHETGHLMGARHERLGDATQGAPFNDNHGFFNNAAACLQRSVMTRILACSTCTRIPFWSNPGTTRCGAAFGVALPSATAADNHNALNQSAVNVANFRCSSPSRTDVWMRDTWDDTGAQPDPATATQAMWRSPYVWIRTSQDTTLIHQHEHQTPALASPVFIYTKLHNGNGGTQNGTLEVWYAHSSSGLAWPATWTLAGSATVSGFAPSSTRIVEIPWTTPSSNPSTAGHFCLVARWTSATDPVGADISNIDTYVRNNNNVVWKNLEPLTGGGGGDATDAVFLVRNIDRLVDNQAPGPIRLRIAPTAEEANGSFFFCGQGSVKLDRKLLDAWQKAAAKAPASRRFGTAHCASPTPTASRSRTSFSTATPRRRCSCGGQKRPRGERSTSRRRRSRRAGKQSAA